MKRIVSFGELMLRLKSPGHERLFQSPLLEATFGGGEANVAVSLALLGMEASYVTALSSDAVGDAALRSLRAQGVDVSRVRRTKERTGIYFLETGADQRASNVVYDRAGSAAAAMKPGDFDWASILAGADWFHVTGITPALSRSAAEAAIEAAAAARKAGAKVSVDLNYRKKLWNYGVAAPEMMGRLAELADVLIANEEDIQLGLGIEAPGAKAGGGIDAESYKALAAETRRRYPKLSVVAITLRESKSADRNGWSAALDGKGGFRVSRKYELCDIVDRVGGGDSFAAGLIFGLLEYADEAKALEFAVAASALKHTIPGDFNLVSRAEVERLASGDGSGRVSR
ncbi:MAG TPA: sugar kinase [Spirochaetales bacterium]|nr:sugar kinase [Spirochaetales bacterium]HRZ63637.1 sugar kinase [Spirochaetia bacterium]